MSSNTIWAAAINGAKFELDRTAQREAAEAALDATYLDLVAAAILSCYVIKKIPYPRRLDNDEPDEVELRRQAAKCIAGEELPVCNLLLRASNDDDNVTRGIAWYDDCVFAWVDLDEVGMQPRIWLAGGSEETGDEWSSEPYNSTNEMPLAVRAVARLLENPSLDISDLEDE